MKKVVTITAIASTAFMSACNNSDAKTLVTSAGAVDSAAQAAPDTIKAMPVDSAMKKVDTSL
jgi:hypothetical protein